MPQPFFEILSSIRLIPVIKLNRTQDAMPLAEALIEGGLRIAEITLRTGCALKSIKAVSGLESIHVGAGTVLNADQCQAAIDAGATFIVSPGLDESVVELCRQKNIPCLPGVATATEIQRAFNLGIRTVKFFPAEAVGGIDALKALAAPFHEMKFVPTGGVNLENLQDYLGLLQTTAVGGSWMVRPELYADGDFSNVVKHVRTAVAAAQPGQN